MFFMKIGNIRTLSPANIKQSEIAGWRFRNTKTPENFVFGATYKIINYKERRKK